MKRMHKTKCISESLHKTYCTLFKSTQTHEPVDSILSSLPAGHSVRKRCVAVQGPRELSLTWQQSFDITLSRLHKKYRSFWPGSKTWRVTAKAQHRPGRPCSDGRGAPKRSLCPALLTTGPPRSHSTEGSLTHAGHFTRSCLL